MTLRELLLPGLASTPHPLYAGAVAVILRDGEVVDHAVVGDAVRYGAEADELPAEKREPMRADTVFDVASITKLFTATVAMALVDRGALDVGAPVREHLPDYADDGRSQVTLWHLLVHTSGLPAVRRLWELRSVEDRIEAVLSARPTATPGMRFEYSCVGYIVAGLLLERVTGAPLPQLVREYVTGPSGMSDTGFLPTADLAARTAATEYQTYLGRGMVRASVHDENSWSLGGTTGNAGLFSTAADLSRFAEMLRRGGELDGVRVLSDTAAVQMTSDQLPADLDPGFRHGVGARVADRAFMGRLADRDACGHTGFTGTSLVVDPSSGTVVILLTNRVHPSRDWSDIAPVRRAIADLAARTAGP